MGILGLIALAFILNSFLFSRGNSKKKGAFRGAFTIGLICFIINPIFGLIVFIFAMFAAGW